MSALTFWLVFLYYHQIFLQKREKAVNAVIVGGMSEVWKEDAFAYCMSEVPLERRNWNQIDSRFRIWANGLNIFKDFQGFDETVSDDTDEFLELKIEKA